MAKVDNSPKPVIIQFDNEDYYFSVTDLILFPSGMNLTHKARGIAQTRKLVERIEKGEVMPTLAIVESVVENNDNEGKQIAAKLKQLAPEIKIIAYTIDPEADWGDFLAMKSNLDPQHTLVKALDQALNLGLQSGDIDKS